MNTYYARYNDKLRSYTNFLISTVQNDGYIYIFRNLLNIIHNLFDNLMPDI
jgi:hypothetical protein